MEIRIVNPSSAAAPSDDPVERMLARMRRALAGNESKPVAIPPGYVPAPEPDREKEER